MTHDAKLQKIKQDLRGRITSFLLLPLSSHNLPLNKTGIKLINKKRIIAASLMLVLIVCPRVLKTSPVGKTCFEASIIQT